MFSFSLTEALAVVFIALLPKLIKIGKDGKM
jgi:hypothetical protein